MEDDAPNCGYKINHGHSSGQTVLFITHDVSTTDSADFVLVLDGGRLVQTGHHAALAAAPGLYGDLTNSLR